LLGDEFDCEPRGRIPVKGKGEVETWYLVGRHADALDGVRVHPELAQPPDAVRDV
jgi:hypothetical protein